MSGRCVIGQTRNISRGGCYILAQESFDVGMVVQLRIESDRIAFETLASVVRTVRDEGFGFAFLDTKPSQTEVLERWLSELAK